MPLLLLFYLFQILKNLIRNTADTTTARQIPFLKDQEIQTHHGQPYFNYTTQYCFGFQIRSLSKNKPHGTLPWHSMLWDVHFFFFETCNFFFFFETCIFFFFFETCIFASGMCNSWDVPSCRCFSCPEHPDGSTRMLSVSLEGRQMAHRTLPRLLIQPRAIFSSLLKPHTVTGKQNQLCSCTTGIPLLHQKVNQNWYKG